MNKLDRIVINGKQLKVVYYNEPLWRADYQYMHNGANARMNYKGASYKYFTTCPDELESYTRRGMRYVKRWLPRRPLVLIDIMDKSTHSAIKQLIGEELLKVPFPLNNEGNPYRVSTESTAKDDYAFLNKLCKFGLDGYYMKRQEKRKNEKVDTFHSEIGLCSSAFDYLELQNPNEKQKIAPALQRKTRKTNNNNNSSSITSITRSLKRYRSNNTNNTTTTNNTTITSPPKKRKRTTTNTKNTTTTQLSF
jgi:hypothetical protein